MEDIYLTWIVPCRRAVVKCTLDYPTLATRWKACLEYGIYPQSLCRWYEIEDQDEEAEAGEWQAPEVYRTGLGAVQEWITTLSSSTTGTTARDVRRGGRGNILNTLSGFPVRLWKGPMRVLLEPRPAAGEAEEESPHIEVTYPYQGQNLTLTQLRATKQVVNSNAWFHMGDVVEFPLFRFLVECGKEAYNRVTFNPNGSFLNGTTLARRRGTEIQPRDITDQPQLHDNLIAMRFQYLLDLLRGAFYSLNPTFASGVPRKPEAQDPPEPQPEQPGTGTVETEADDTSPPRGSGTRDTVYGRGLVYGAALGNPGVSPVDRSVPRASRRPQQEWPWTICTNNWGIRGPAGLADNLPTLQSVGGISGAHADNQLLTPATTCSPSALLMNFYMQNLFGWGSNAVSWELTEVDSSRLEGKYDRLTPLQLLGAEARERLQACMSLKEQLDRIILALTLHGRDNPEPFWLEPAYSRRPRLDARTRNPFWARRIRRNGGRAMEWTNERLGVEGLDDDGREVIVEVHEGIYGGWVQVLNQIRQLVNGEEERGWWATSGVQAPDVIQPDWPDSDRHPRPAESPCREHHGLTEERFTSLQDALSQKRDEIQEAARQTGSLRVRQNMAEVFKDLTVIGQTAHEKCYVKVWPFDSLMERNSLPLSHRISAYDPLKGIECFPDSSLRESGQLYHFEATGALKRWLRTAHTVQLCGVGPFKWQPVPNNLMYVRTLMSERNPRGEPRVYIGEQEPPDNDDDVRPKIDYVHTSIDPVLRGAYPGAEEGRGRMGETKRIIVVYGQIGEGGQSPAVDHAPLVADRALPFPTMSEVAGRYPTIQNVGSEVTAVCSQLNTERESVNMGSLHSLLVRIRDNPILRQRVRGGRERDRTAFARFARGTRNRTAQLTESGTLDRDQVSRGHVQALQQLRILLARPPGSSETRTRAQIWFGAAGTNLVRDLTSATQQLGVIYAERYGSGSFRFSACGGS